METLLLDIDEGVATLTLNRPAQKNALNPALRTELISVIDRVRRDESVRVLVLTGAGKCLSKEESEVANLMKERELLIERIKSDLMPVDRAEPDRVQQVNNAGMQTTDSILFGDEEQFS